MTLQAMIADEINDSMVCYDGWGKVCCKLCHDEHRKVLAPNEPRSPMITERSIAKKNPSSLCLHFHYNIQEYANQGLSFHSFVIFTNIPSLVHQLNEKRVIRSLASVPAIAVPDYSSPSLSR